MVQLWHDSASGVRVVRSTNEHEIDTLLKLFAFVAEEKGWQPGDDLLKYREQSVYFGVEQAEKLLGGLQLEFPNTEGSFSCHSVWPEVTIVTANRTAHVAILALNSACRGQGSFWPLVTEMWRYAVGKGIDELLIECSPANLRIYRRLGWPLEIRGDRRMHWGSSETYLCSLSVRGVADAMLSRLQVPAYRRVVDQMFRLNSSDPCGVHTDSGAATQPVFV